MASAGDVSAQKVVVASLARANKVDIERAWEAVQYAPKPRTIRLLQQVAFEEHVLKMSPEQVRARAVGVCFSKIVGW
jgi:2-isopropylmalate synthase